MKQKGSKNYSKRDVRVIKTMFAENAKREKPFTIKHLSQITARVLGRPQVGVYAKMLVYAPKRTRRTPVANATVSTTKSVTFGKPSKIEISDAGMTFYF